MDRTNDNLTILGAKTKYSMNYAPEVLETFINKHQDNDYFVKFNCPEFTSLCPITGQPDFCNYLHFIYSRCKDGRIKIFEIIFI